MLGCVVVDHRHPAHLLMQSPSFCESDRLCPRRCRGHAEGFGEIGEIGEISVGF